jgi:hypothetical protein
MLPRYDANGTMDPYNIDDDFETLGNVLVWNEWGNKYNQEYIKECCESRIGVFDTNHVVIVDVNIDFQKLMLFWDRNCLTSEERIFRYIPKLLEIIDWAIIHFYESDTFVFIAHEKLAHHVDQIKDYFTKINIQHICITDV